MRARICVCVCMFVWVCVWVCVCVWSTHTFPHLPPPPRVHPPPGGGGDRHRLVPKNNATVSYCAGLHIYESSLLELMRTSFVLTHCTPQTSQNVP